MITVIQNVIGEEMHYAEWLIRRVIFQEGTPVVSKLNPISEAFLQSPFNQRSKR